MVLLVLVWCLFVAVVAQDPIPIQDATRSCACPPTAVMSTIYHPGTAVRAGFNDPVVGKTIARPACDAAAMASLVVPVSGNKGWVLWLRAKTTGQ